MKFHLFFISIKSALNTSYQIDQGTVLTPKGMSVASQSDDHFFLVHNYKFYIYYRSPDADAFVWSHIHCPV